MNQIEGDPNVGFVEASAGTRVEPEQPIYRFARLTALSGVNRVSKQTCVPYG